jgi:hypothetical protein
VRELDHPWRDVTAVAGDPRAKQVGDLTVGPCADALGLVTGDVGGVDRSELRWDIGHVVAREHAGVAIEMAADT